MIYLNIKSNDIASKEEKRFQFGKINFTSNGKINEAAVTVCLKKTVDGHHIFTAHGEVWDAHHRDLISGGQNLDELNEYLVGNPLFDEIYGFWKKYHLNDMHAGTPEQEREIIRAKEQNKLNPATNHYYEDCCQLLRELNLYEVELNGEPYKYGHGWLYYPIPAPDLILIRKLFHKDSNAMSA